MLGGPPRGGPCLRLAKETRNQKATTETNAGKIDSTRQQIPHIRKPTASQERGGKKPFPNLWKTARRTGRKDKNESLALYSDVRGPRVEFTARWISLQCTQPLAFGRPCATFPRSNRIMIPGEHSNRSKFFEGVPPSALDIADRQFARARERLECSPRFVISLQA